MPIWWKALCGNINSCKSAQLLLLWRLFLWSRIYVLMKHSADSICQSTLCVSWKCILQISAKVFWGPLSRIWWRRKNEFEMLVKATDKSVIFIHMFRIPKSSILIDGVIFVWNELMHLYRTTMTMILANFTTSQLNKSQMEISVRNFHLKKASVLSDGRKTNDFGSLELNSTNYWNAVENPNSHERALPVRTEVSKLHQSIVITLWIKYWVGRDL